MRHKFAEMTVNSFVDSVSFVSSLSMTKWLWLVAERSFVTIKMGKPNAAMGANRTISTTKNSMDDSFSTERGFQFFLNLKLRFKIINNLLAVIFKHSYEKFSKIFIEKKKGKIPLDPFSFRLA